MFPIDDFVIPESELTWTFSRSGGPGGQNVNKVASKAQLRWAMAGNETIPPAIKERLRTSNPSRVTTEGDFLIVSQESRDQEQNRELCLEKLAALVRRAATVPKARKKTKPTKASQRRRVEGKRQAAARKSDRKGDRGD